MCDYPLPPVFCDNMRSQLGDTAGLYFAALERPPLRGIRLNPLKPSAELPEGLLEPVPWYPGFLLSEGSTAGAHPLHEAGAWYIQEPSAMSPVAVLAPRPGERVLDLCAAPGGKSTQIAECLRGEGLLVCNEPVPSRAKILSRNVERMGVTNALTVSADPDALAPLWEGCFDAVLVDAPCSGEGMFRRHPETRAEWQPSSPADCAARQKRILSRAARMTRPGGRLVYSTCTFNTLENEQVIADFLAAFPDWEAVPFTLPGAPDAPGGMLHLFPHQVPGEGHFIASLRRRGDEHAAPSPDAFAPAAERLARPDRALLAAWQAFAPNGCSANAQWEDTLLSCPDLPPLKGIHVLRAGLRLGTLKGKVFAPDHALALAPGFDFPALPITLEDARRYQAGEVLSCSETLRGWILLACSGIPLGFAKAADGQLKNHYPKGLRRMGG